MIVLNFFILYNSVILLVYLIHKNRNKTKFYDVTNLKNKILLNSLKYKKYKYNTTITNNKVLYKYADSLCVYDIFNGIKFIKITLLYNNQIIPITKFVLFNKLGYIFFNFSNKYYNLRVGLNDNNLSIKNCTNLKIKIIIKINSNFDLYNIKRINKCNTDFIGMYNSISIFSDLLSYSIIYLNSKMNIIYKFNCKHISINITNNTVEFTNVAFDVNFLKNIKIKENTIDYDYMFALSKIKNLLQISDVNNFCLNKYNYNFIKKIYFKNKLYKQFVIYIICNILKINSFKNNYIYFNNNIANNIIFNYKNIKFKIEYDESKLIVIYGGVKFTNVYKLRICE